MKDIKKRFIDILFEPVEDEEIEQVEQPEQEVIEKPKKDETSTLKARDVLYKKSENSAFIDLNEVNKPVTTKEEKKENDYEFASQISPIFGVLKENKRRPIIKDNELNDAIVNKPDDSHLEIITSPIYGYGDQDDFEGSRNMTAGLLADEAELHMLLDNEETTYEQEDDYLPEEEDYQEEYFEQEDVEEEYVPEEIPAEQEEENIFMHQRYDYDEGEITLFDTIEDEE